MVLLSANEQNVMCDQLACYCKSGKTFRFNMIPGLEVCTSVHHPMLGLPCVAYGQALLDTLVALLAYGMHG